ncbi:hypothetical protein Tco_0925215, partial [Tanacetum coccineum]
TSTNLISQLNVLIAELEASGDYKEVFDLVMELRDDRRDEQDKVADFNRLIVVDEEKIHVVVGCAIGIMETQAIDDQDPLVNYDNDNENDDLGYQSEEYFDEVQEDDENNHSNRNVVKRGITRLYKFRREYGKPDGIKLSVTFDALNRISGKHRALFLSFLGDMVREHIGLKILSWKKRYFDVDLTVRKLIEKKEIEPDEEPARGTLWLKGRVNKDGEYPDDEIRSVGDKLKETEDKIKEGTLKGMIMGTNSMTFCIGKEKGGYASGRVWEVEVLLHTRGGLRVDSNPINSSGSFSADEEGGTPIFGCENDASIQKSNGLATLEKEMETRNSQRIATIVSIDTSVWRQTLHADVGITVFKTLRMTE